MSTVKNCHSPAGMNFSSAGARLTNLLDCPRCKHGTLDRTENGMECADCGMVFDIVAIIGAKVKLKREVDLRSYMGLCPFCGSDGFHVNPHKQLFHCFGCHNGGDVSRFMREFNKLKIP